MNPDKWIELFLYFINWFRFLQIVDDDEGAVVLRLGRYLETLEPGHHFIRPFYYDRVRIRRTAWDTTDLVAQSLTTSDDRAISISIALRHRIVDVRKALIDAGDFEQCLRDSSIGAVGELVAELTYDELRAITSRRKLTNEVRRQLAVWGIELDRVQISEFTRSRTFRVVNGQ